MIKEKYLKLFFTACNIIVGCYVFMYAFNWLMPGKTQNSGYTPNAWEFSWFLTDSTFILVLSLLLWRLYEYGNMKFAMLWFFIQSSIRFYYEFPYFYKFNNEFWLMKPFILIMSALCALAFIHQVILLWAKPKK